jgi:hypothetical protein
VLVIGDSLEVGSGSDLQVALADLPVEIDARRNRTSREGVSVLADRLGPEHGTIVFPLGTNDTSPQVFAASLDAVQELAGGRCVVVATISRPTQRGSSAAALNEVVEQFAAQGGVQVADWRSAAAGAGMLGRDRIHATGEGYAVRAALLGEAVSACLLGGDLGGLPAPKDPNARPPERRERPRRRRKPPPPARPVKLRAPAELGALPSTLARAVSVVAAAGAAARTAATPDEPEPVLGAP